MDLLNLGCGHRYHKDWTNVDFVSTGEGVIAHNLLRGIPFPNNQFDVAYHSHVLEHFSKESAPIFLKECFRVLKPGGLIRIAVPDLEQIAREYIKNLEGALCGDESAVLNYDWIMVELYDQAVRTYSGGAYGKFWHQESVPNEDYMIKRMGHEYLNSRKIYYANRKLQQNSIPNLKKPQPKPPSITRFLKPTTYITKLRKVFETQKQADPEQEAYTAIGKFRASGEIHQWMYDRFSLKRLLETSGFVDIAQTSAFNSRIPDWVSFGLDTENGEIRKPDSLFMEATKPLP